MSNTLLFNGDCLSILNNIEEHSVDMVLVDPPYGITSRNEWDKIIPFEPMWAGIHRVIKKNTPVLFFTQLPFASDLIQSNKKEFRYEWIWNKKLAVGFLNANRMPLRVHENILVFYQSLPKYHPIFWEADTYHVRGGPGLTSKNYGEFKQLPPSPPTKERYPLDIIEISNSRRKGKMHPTEKPVEILEYLIKTYTDENDTVLDFCMGSGSTGVACVNLNRNFIGIELNKEYYELAESRMNECKQNQIDRK